MPADRASRTRYWLGRSVHTWRRDMVWGVLFGLAMAGYYSLIAIVIYTFAGSAPFEANNASLGEALAAYWVGGLLGGVIFGLIKPLARNAFGAVVVGIVVATPASVAVVLAVDGKDVIWEAVVIMAVIFGTAGGLAFSNSHRSGPSQDDFEDLEETYDRFKAGELSEDEIAAFVKRHGGERRGSAPLDSKQG